MTALPERGARDVLYVADLSGFTDPYFHSPNPRGAARGVVEMLRRVIAQRAPAYMAVAGDTPWPTFRDDLAPKGDYKAGRVRSGAERAAVLEQRRLAGEMVEDGLGVRVFKARGFEADDLIATITDRGAAEGLRVVVMALDKDMMQLVRGEHIVMWDGKGGAIGPPEVRAKFGVRPEQMADFLALAGDRCDRVAGLPGIGAKGAAKILARFNTIESACAAAAAMERDSSIGHRLFIDSPALGATLARAHRDGTAALMKKLTTTRRDVPLPIASLDDLRVPE